MMLYFAICTSPLEFFRFGVPHLSLLFYSRHTQTGENEALGFEGTVSCLSIWYPLGIARVCVLGGGGGKGKGHAEKGI